MKSLFAKIIGLCAVVAILGAPAHAADGPTFLKRTVNIKMWRFLRHWATPTAKTPQYNTWCWVPQMDFQVIGPVAGGSQWIVEFDKPDGKPWLVRNCRSDEATDGEIVTIKTPPIDDVKDEKKATTAKMGSFPFHIRLKNELEGTNKVVFSGKYIVKTYAPNQSIPEYKGKSEFYADADWHLPIGFIWLDPTDNDDAFPLKVSMWFRGLGSSPSVQALIFKDGQQVGDVAGHSEDAELATGVDDNAHRWKLITFTWSQLRSLVAGKEKPSGYNWTYLSDAPGVYQIKVLRDNKIARTASFTIGTDGKVVDNGIAKANNLGGIRMVLPVKVVGTADGAWNPLAWKTGAFYGNPLKGFTAP
ncbi:hypothetical protein IAD21_03875 [Abditibacteriota bacterium]|nr:hypothetical protein IAD21_03875 [Abditibacteriota bacterium]